MGMKKYALKLTRDTGSGIVKIQSVIAAPPGIVPYRIRHPQPGYAESLQIFGSRREADAARAAELIAADFAGLPTEKLFSILQADLDRVAKLGISAAALCRISNTSYGTLQSFQLRKVSPNPRIVARFHILADRLDDVAKSACSILPDSGGCGNPKKGRGGNPDLWMKQTRFRPRGKNDVAKS